MKVISSLLWFSLISVCPAAGSATEPAASVVISVHPCATQTNLLFSGATLRYSIVRLDGREVAARRYFWDSDDPSQLQWTARIPPGVYHYGVYARVRQSDFPCTGSGTFAVLPGDVRRIDTGVYGAVGDPIVPLYVYGTAPKNVEVRVELFDGQPGCGSHEASLRSYKIATERDDIGYYAQDGSLAGSDAGTGAILGVIIRRSGKPDHIIRIVADYPKENIAVAPTSVRLDLTPALIKNLDNAPPGVLSCLGG
jgi:hypothetical protein